MTLDLAALTLPNLTLEQQEDGVLIVTLSRPAKRNALSDPFIQQLHTVFVNMPEGVRAVMISGQGSHFCAGLDLSELVARDIDPEYRL